MTDATVDGIDQALEQKVQSVIEAHRPIDEAIALMRDAGLSKIPCIKLVRKYMKISLGEAKDIVHLSPVWDDVRERDEHLHDVLEAALEQDGWTRKDFIRDGLPYTSYTIDLRPDNDLEEIHTR